MASKYKIQKIPLGFKPETALMKQDILFFLLLLF